MKRMLSAFLIALTICIFIFITSSHASQNRGRYVYDEAERLSLESELSIGSYLLQVDVKTNYEIALVLPKTVFSEKQIINWFNASGVGKKSVDNGTAIFIFPDNSWFVAIGSGNDKISVPYSKTQGDKILIPKNMEEDLPLTVLRFIWALNGKIEESSPKVQFMSFWEKIYPDINLILLWALFASLVVFLIKQKDGFQWSDVIIPVAIVVSFWIFIGISALSGSEIFKTYEDYGVITKSKFDERHYVTPVVISTGKSTTVIYVPHTDYINRTEILNYELAGFQYEFVSTDNKSAWEIKPGDYSRLNRDIKSGELAHASRFNDISGGKTIGDGVGGGFLSTNK